MSFTQHMSYWYIECHFMQVTYFSKFLSDILRDGITDFGNVSSILAMNCDLTSLLSSERSICRNWAIAAIAESDIPNLYCYDRIKMENKGLL